MDEEDEEIRRDEEKRRKLQKLSLAVELSDITALTSFNFSSWASSATQDATRMHSVAELRGTVMWISQAFYPLPILLPITFAFTIPLPAK